MYYFQGSWEHIPPGGPHQLIKKNHHVTHGKMKTLSVYSRKVALSDNYYVFSISSTIKNILVGVFCHKLGFNKRTYFILQKRIEKVFGRKYQLTEQN